MSELTDGDALHSSPVSSSPPSYDPLLHIRMRSDSDIDIIASIYEIEVDDDMGPEPEPGPDTGPEPEPEPEPDPEWALPSASTNEDTSALMFSYNTIMADFQHNMMVYQQNISDAVVASRPIVAPHTATGNSASEDIGAMMYSYNTIMSDFQHNMLVYQRNVGTIIVLSRQIAPMSRFLERNQSQPSARFFNRVNHRGVGISRIYPETERAVPRRRNTIDSAAIETSEYVGGIDEMCPISLETFVPGERVSTIRVCNHKFRADALAEWFARDNNACPVCRRTVRIASPQASAIRTAAQVMLALERVSRIAGF